MSAMQAMRPCRYPGCPQLVTSGYCDRHRKQEQRRQDERRGSAAERGYDARWQRARLIFLQKNPLCIECQKEGHIEPATVVDHIVPHKGNVDLFWDESNWQPLCRKHHDIKTAMEDGGFGNKVK